MACPATCQILVPRSLLLHRVTIHCGQKFSTPQFVYWTSDLTLNVVGFTPRAREETGRNSGHWPKGCNWSLNMSSQARLRKLGQDPHQPEQCLSWEDTLGTGSYQTHTSCLPNPSFPVSKCVRKCFRLFKTPSLGFRVISLVYSFRVFTQRIISKQLP